jgi:hypothetical protein
MLLGKFCFDERVPHAAGGLLGGGYDKVQVSTQWNTGLLTASIGSAALPTKWRIY